MKLYEQIVDRYGKKYLDLILLIYINFYFSEIEIIDLCGRWIPRRKILKEKFWLVQHAADEIRHSELFKKGVELLGLDWENLELKKYRLRDIEGRFGKLEESDDELEVLIGLNLYGEGVLAMEELIQLSHNAQQYFPAFKQILKEEGTHLGFGVEVARRLIKESVENQKRAQSYCDWYRNHLQQYLWKDISPQIDQAIEFGLVDKSYREKTVARFKTVMSSVGLSVE